MYIFVFFGKCLSVCVSCLMNWWYVTVHGKTGLNSPIDMSSVSNYWYHFLIFWIICCTGWRRSKQNLCQLKNRLSFFRVFRMTMYGYDSTILPSTVHLNKRSRSIVNLRHRTCLITWMGLLMSISSSIWLPERRYGNFVDNIYQSFKIFFSIIHLTTFTG